MKKVLLILSVLTMMVVMSGCRIEYTYDMSDGKNVKQTVIMYLPKDEIDKQNEKSDTSKTSKQKNAKKAKVVTLEDGKKYYKSKSVEKKTIEEVNNEQDTGIISPTLIYMPVESANETATEFSSDDEKSLKELYESIKFKVTFVLSEDIVDTNGTLGKNKRTVTFDYGDVVKGAYYAYTESSKNKVEADKKAPKIKGIRPNKYVNNIDKMTVTDNVGIKSVTCNGKKLYRGTIEHDGKTEYYWTLMNGNKFRQGKNTIVATDISGNKTKKTFLFDNQGPVIKKIKNYATVHGKNLVFYVKDKKSGLKKVTYAISNGKMKKVKASNIQLVKKGKYKGYYKVSINNLDTCNVYLRVLDNVGNVTYVTGISVVN